MALLVHKYGGTSVADVERIHHVAAQVAEWSRAGHQLVVVVSAMSGETDRLLRLAQAVTAYPDEREMDMLLSTGERTTIALLAMELRGRGIHAQSFTGRQVGIVTDNAHTKARIAKVGADRIKQALADGIIPVVAGFQGINERSDVTTLGRGGSDLTAVALAAALQAERCTIYTDVDGVYTADPNVVPGAHRLEKVSYEEMLELASLGAQVLQTRSVQFAARFGVPVEVKSTFTQGPGTLITNEDAAMEDVSVSGITGDRNQAKLTVIGVPDRPGIAAKIFGPVAHANIIVDMIIQNVGQGALTDVSFTVPRGDLTRAVTLMQEVAKEIEAQSVEITEAIAKVSLVGVGMRSHSGIASKMFEVLSREGVNIMMISTSEIKISCVIEEKYLELAMRTLHAAFGLERDSEHS